MTDSNMAVMNWSQDGGSMDEIGREIRRLREEKGWSQAQLAVDAGIGVSAVSLIETGKRNPSATTLAKIAAALGVGVADLFPKAEEPLPFAKEVEQRLSAVPEALSKYILERAETHERELENPESPHFRTATTAALWLTQVNEEARQWSDWAFNYLTILMPPTAGPLDPQNWAYTFSILGGLAAFDGVLDEAGKRIAQMNDKPDELARKRLEKATAEAQEGMRRVEDLQKAANV
jgi:transcriptional regulator with XRE-family HTH domain